MVSVVSVVGVMGWGGVGRGGAVVSWCGSGLVVVVTAHLDVLLILLLGRLKLPLVFFAAALGIDRHVGPHLLLLLTDLFQLIRVQLRRMFPQSLSRRRVVEVDVAAPLHMLGIVFHFERDPPGR